MVRWFTVRLIPAILSAMLVASAIEPIGTVTAPGPIRISGAGIPATAAASAPVGVGDQISTLDSAALIRFEGRGVITLGERSSVKLAANGGQTMICLLDGSYHYKFAPGSMLTACKEDKPLAPNLEGSVLAGKNPITASATRDAASVAGIAASRSKTCPQGHVQGHDCAVIK
jgi:hypothetical protein